MGAGEAHLYERNHAGDTSCCPDTGSSGSMGRQLCWSVSCRPVRLKPFRLFVLLLAVCLMGMSMPAFAENAVALAKANKMTSGKLVSNSKGVRFQKKNGKYVKSKWISYKGEYFYFRKNGYTKRNTFFTWQGARYYAGEDGAILVAKWLKKGKYAYYLKKDGSMAANETLKISGRKYVFKKNGRLDTAQSDEIKSDQYLFVGDSRTVGMSMFAPHNNADYIGKVSMGYSWLATVAGPRVKSILSRTPNINVVFCFGVNDIGNVDAYIAYYKKLISSYRKTDFYFLAVNPVGGGSRYVTNAMIEGFNKKLKAAVGKKRYIDTYTHLVKTGFTSPDSVHYDGATYVKIYAYTLEEIQER